VLREQLAVAERRDLPVVLHCVRAFEPMMKMLSEYDLRAVIFHGFIGSVQQAERAVSRGYYLSFGVGAFRSPKTLEALRLMPLDRLFVETDESEVGIENVYERVAQARGVELEELKYKLEENYKKIFDIK
jgi:TatD DNase family protein